MKLFTGIAMSLLFSAAVCAQQDVEINGTVQYPLVKKTQNRSLLNAPIKYIRLLNIELSDKAWDKLTRPAPIIKNANLASSYAETKLPSQIQLGMGQVPVLDQGPYGTCVTFANTAAIEAAANLGDYISQVCQLELGQYLENSTHGNLASGWDGSNGRMVLNQMSSFGFVPKNIERSSGCGGLTSYPNDGVVPENQLNLTDYDKISAYMTDVSWSSIMDEYEAFNDDVDRDEVLTKVKNTLMQGDRLTFGILLFAPHLGTAGAVGIHKTPNDTWVVSSQINDAINQHGVNGGHEMIITGYNDDAIAKDENGVSHKGLLTLRNSWGKTSGNAGDFYMSYDYFKRLAIEIQRIRQLQ